MGNPNLKAVLWVLIVLVSPGAGLGVPHQAGQAAQADTVLTDLRDLDDLKSSFSQDADLPRLVLLLSPT